MTNLIALPAQTVLVGDYRIQRVLGAGGFGVTYLADEMALSREVTIKEYFPSDFAARTDGIEAAPRSSDCAGDFKWGLDRFLDEAQTLAKFDHPNIVRVFRYFRANQTGYMVLKFEEGQSLKGWLKSLARAPRQSELDAIVAPLLDALDLIHKADFLHRDIAPDNIIIRKDGAPVLIDFGSARGEIAAHSKTVSALVKPGYSPYEQYAERSSQQGPWSDIYALAATLYHAVTGKRPPDAPSRMMKDEYVPARTAAVGAYRAGFLNAIDKALKLDVDARPRSVAAWRGDLLAPDPQKPGWLTRGRGAKSAEDELVLAGAGVAPAPAPGARILVPPQPDAPGAKGVLLDFLDAMKRPQAADPRPSPKPGTDAAQASLDAREPAKPKTKPAKPKAAVNKAAVKPKSKLKLTPEAQPEPATKAAAKAAQKAPARPERAAPAKPRPVRVGTKPRRGGLWMKLGFACLLAGGVVATQMRFLGPSPGPQKSAAAVIQEIPVLLKELRGHSGDVDGVAFTEDGASIVSASRDATLKLWSAATGVVQRTVALDTAHVNALAVAGPRAITAHGDGSVVLYDLDRGERIALFKRNDAEIWSVAFLGGPQQFAAASHDYTTAIWDVSQTSAPKFVLEGHESAAQAVAYSSAGPWIATGSADKTVRLIDTDSHETVRVYKGQKDFVTALAFSPDGRTLAVGTLDGTVRIYSTSSTRLVKQLSGHKSRIAALAFSPDGTVMASAADEGIVRLWNAKRGRTMRSLGGHAGGAKSVAFSPDGTRLVSGGADAVIRIWSVPPAQTRD